MPSFLTTTYTAEPGKGNNPPRFRAGATGSHALPGESADFGDRSYTVAPDGSIRRERHVRISKKLRRKIRAAAKAAQMDADLTGWRPPEPPASTCRLTDGDKVEA